MSWVKLDDRLPHHRKVRALSLKLGLAAYGLYVASVQFCQRDETDGLLRVEDLHMVFPTASRRVLLDCAGALVQVGLWDPVAGGWRVHDYLDWNLSVEERKAQRRGEAVRQKKYRESLRDVSRDATRDSRRDSPVSRLDYSSPLLSSPLHSSPKGPSGVTHTSAGEAGEAGPPTPTVRDLIAETAKRLGV